MRERVRLGYVVRERLGEGKGRIAFATSDPLVVLKRDKEGGWVNILEAEIWEKADEELKRMLAPVLKISSDGRWLAMRRGHRLFGPSPKGLDWLRDRKNENWGIIDGKPCLIDYAHPDILERVGIVWSRPQASK
jgi:hypothetical protein